MIRRGGLIPLRMLRSSPYLALAMVAFLASRTSPLFATAMPQPRVVASRISPTAVGLFFTEPTVESGTDVDAANFGVACTTYLDFTVAGQPEFGQCPLSSTITRVRAELGLRTLSVTDACRLAVASGATHVVTSRLSGGSAAGPITLTLQLNEAATNHLVGERWRLTGSEAEIRADLPRVAREVSMRLGIARPLLPETVDLAVDEMRGYSTWLKPLFDTPPVGLRDQIIAVAQHSAAVMLLAESLNRGHAELRAQQALLVTKLSPRNAFAWADCASEEPEAIFPFREQLRALREQYPHCSLLTFTEMMVERANAEHDAELATGQQLILQAPRDPQYPYTLDRTIAQRADAIRNDRQNSYLTDAEKRQLKPFYAREASLLAQATAQDPQFSAAWLDRASVAILQGDNMQARAYFKKALDSSTDHAAAFARGLEMLQDKWGGTAAERQALLRQIAADRTYEPEEAGHFYSILMEQGATDLAKSLNAEYASRVDAIVSANPKDARIAVVKADFLWNEGDRTEALAEYKRATDLAPENEFVLYAYANALRQAKQTSDAITAFRKVIEVAPTYRDAQMYLGVMLLRQDTDIDEAIQCENATLQYQPNARYAHDELGQMYMEQGKWPAAVAEYQKALKYGDRSPYMFGLYCMTLAEAGQGDEAGRFGARAIALFDPDYSVKSLGKETYGIAVVHAGVAHVYRLSGRSAEALSELRRAMELSPDGIDFHCEYGDVLEALGRTAEARAEWQLVLEKGASSVLKKHAREELELHPAPQ